MAEKKETPVFVKIDKYRDILDVVDVIKHKLEEARETVAHIVALKKEEDMELAAWSDNLSDIDHKLRMIDKTLFEPNI